jgi:virginiamycin A acetyltransferase
MIYLLRKKIKHILYYFLNTPEYRKDVLISGYSRGIQNVSFEGKNAVPDRCNFSGNIKIGYATTLGYNNLLGGNISIGKYCQIGADVAIHTTNHPISYMSTYINTNLFNGELKKLKQTNTVIIGNDVWVGHNVIIVGNVTVGNGAILAAGAIITKDVLPYTIVAGVPAKAIKKRFCDAVIKEIEDLKWWDLSEEDLEKVKPMFFKDFQNKESIYDN